MPLHKDTAMETERSSQSLTSPFSRHYTIPPLPATPRSTYAPNSLRPNTAVMREQSPLSRCKTRRIKISWTPPKLVAGHQLMYLGTLRWSSAEQRASVDRLSRVTPRQAPDNQRVLTADQKTQGLPIAYQWRAGGNPTQGFVH